MALARDARYDSGTTFWLFFSLNGGTPSPKSVRMSSFVSQSEYVSHPGHLTGLVVGLHFRFVQNVVLG